MAEILIPVVALAGAAVLSSMDKKKQFNNNINSYNSFIRQNKPEDTIDVNSVDQNSSLNSSKFEGFTNVEDSQEHTQTQTQMQSQTQTQTSDINQQTFISLTGEKMNQRQLIHNNMQHYCKDKNIGRYDTDGNPAILDNLNGTGSQQFKKNETAPLFKPEENMSWNNGTPNNTDFFQSRMNAPTTMNNVTLWDQQHVAPGLNLGYTTDGTGGFNSGLNGRDLHLPRTVNELRVDNNQRQTFEFAGLEGPAQSDVKNPGFLGRVEKKLPDPTFAVGPDRWFTTTGAQIRPTNRSEIQISEENRGLNDTNYFGPRNNPQVEASYTERNFEDSNRQQLGSLPISNVNAGDRFAPAKNNFGVDGFKAMANNRCTTQHTLPIGGVSGVVNSIMAPINDMLRPSRKQNAVGNIRIMGSINNKEGQGPYVIDKNARTRTTIRDTTGSRIGLNHLNVQQQNNDGYLSTGITPTNTFYDLNKVSYTGGSSAQNSAMINTDVKQLRVDNVNKSYVSRPTVGNNTQFLGSINAETHRNEENRNNNRMWVPSNMPRTIPSTEMIGNVQPQCFTHSEKPNDRIDDSLLTAFKNNPYTQSLNSVVPMY